MSYRLHPDETLIDGMRRVADEQLAAALGAIEAGGEDPDRSVHELRKHMKKLRGLLRLARPGLGATYAAENLIFRETARMFSEIRDSQVLSKTLSRLSQGADDATAERLHALQGWAAETRRQVLDDSGHAKRLEAAHDRLTTARQRLAQWRIDGPEAVALSAGIAKTYGRVCKRHRDARAAGNPQNLHEWRKRLKYHMYHCRLLHPAWPDGLQARIATLDEMTECLGDSNDLVHLDTRLMEARQTLPEDQVKKARELAAEQNRMLRRRAFALAPRITEEGHDALSRRLTGYGTSAPRLKARA